MSTVIKRLLLSTAISVLAATSLSARNINIYGKVTIKGSDEPAAGASIVDANINRLIALANADGEYNITVDSEAELIFIAGSCDELHEKVNGRHVIDVALMPHATELNEIVVTAKGGKTGLVTEPTDLDLDGNNLRLKTKVKIPSKLFNSDKRMIIQPAIYNVTRRQLSFLNPIVFDGRRYAITQERMHDWEPQRDTLYTYQQIKQDSRRKDNTIYIIDSLHVVNPKDDFMGLIISSLENYNRVVYADTFEIARGSVNPLRFLSYSLDPLPMNEDYFKPKPEVELRDAYGSMNLMFPVGKSNLDLSLGNNKTELDALISEINRIYDDPNASVKGLTINGYASPEGSLSYNEKLAESRMKSAMDVVLKNIYPEVRREADVKVNASVARWEEVVAMLKADGYTDEADQIQRILATYSGPESRSWAISRLPFYNSLIQEKYLPRLRKVDYQISFSTYRPLTDEEIAALYVKNPSGLSRYQFYRYYNSLEGDAKEKAIRQALKVYPNSVVAATDLSELMLKRDESPYEVLLPFFKDPAKVSKLPLSTRVNMGIASMKDMNFSLADSVLRTVPDTPETHKAKIYAAAQNGRFNEVIEEINNDSPLNEVLLLLATKTNSLAWQKAKLLGDSPVEEYVKAVAANRLDNYLEAIVHLENALKLDPSLIEIAKIDGDVIDLLEDTDLNDSSSNATDE